MLMLLGRVNWCSESMASELLIICGLGVVLWNNVTFVDVCL